MSTITIIVDAVCICHLLYHVPMSTLSCNRSSLTWMDSTPGVLKAWKTFSTDYNLGDSTTIAHATHGRRLYDTLKEYCGITDENRLLEEIDRFEDQVIEGGPTALPGAIDLISQLSSQTSSRGKWTIVTSASNKYAPRALDRAGVPMPLLGLITSNDVLEGKPHPGPYLAGAQLCGVEAKNCLVIEDAISGLKSGHAAGALTLAVCTSTPHITIVDSGVNPDYTVTDLTQVSVNVVDERLQVTINSI
ncbi:HAD-like domain-containing protein [Crassisporium funariophilum]|nr:HAD-like domain-containing protein [Crassisporium funariophilum]